MTVGRQDNPTPPARQPKKRSGWVAGGATIVSFVTLLYIVELFDQLGNAALQIAHGHDHQIAILITLAKFLVGFEIFQPVAGLTKVRFAPGGTVTADWHRGDCQIGVAASKFGRTQATRLP